MGCEEVCSIQWDVRRVFNPVGCKEVCSIQWDAYIFVITVQRVLFEHLTTWVAARGRCSFHIPELSKGAV